MSAGVRAFAYYFPQYHRDARNDAMHGEGWTEWTLLREARPRFDGHAQPKVCAWGEFDESDPAWSAREIDLAADHGLSGFIFDWYWYDGRPFLNGALERGFLRAPNRNRLEFALMWANHDWVQLYPASPDAERPLLMAAHTARASFDALVEYVLEHYFQHENHLKLDGAPYFSIYELGSFIAGLGGLEAATDALEHFRSRVRAAGFPDLHLNAVVWGFNVLPSEVPVENLSDTVRALGFSSLTSYAWIHHHQTPPEDFPHGRYQDALRDNQAAWAHHAAAFDLPYFPNVSMGWDPSPRTRQDAPYAAHGYPWHAVLEGNTPEAFGQALEAARDFVGHARPEHRIITVNAWNEWTEGSYLLPDTLHGTRYLEAVRRALSPEALSPDDPA